MVNISSKSEVRYLNFPGRQKPLIEGGGGGLHVTCDAHFPTRTRDDVCVHICEIS